MQSELPKPSVKAIAFYLPQFHPIRENDEWWGPGFTEWRNVAKARPLFPGHYQPHLPADLGFYDLRVPEIREQQAALAMEYGIHGFCYYHYWFNGRRILERPLSEVLASGRPDFPFCVCWANENWTRVWDGGDRHVLLRQDYDHDDDRAHIRSLIPAFLDPRYIRINGRPLFLVYRTELLPNPIRTAEIWREECVRAGVGDPYLARVEHFVANLNPTSIGFDAAVEFAPEPWGPPKFRGPVAASLAKWGFFPKAFVENTVLRYDLVVAGMSSKAAPPFTRFRCVTPMWDNSPRRRAGAWIFVDSTPEKYQRWLDVAIHDTKRRLAGDECLVFLNAWNEWGEGCHLEPDLKWGRAYLEATRTALKQTSDVVSSNSPVDAVELARKAPRWKRLYWATRKLLAERLDFVRTLVRHVT